MCWKRKFGIRPKFGVRGCYRQAQIRSNLGSDPNLGSEVLKAGTALQTRPAGHSPCPWEIRISPLLPPKSPYPTSSFIFPGNIFPQLCAEPSSLFPHGISTQVHFPNPLPSLHSLPLHPPNPGSLAMLDYQLFPKKSQFGISYSQLDNLSPNLGLEIQPLLLGETLQDCLDSLFPLFHKKFLHSHPPKSRRRS